ncbi:hypothetical protein EIP91_000744 [Steccherinum ochraceum]|uniref:Ubiquitin-like domain-containing protein n=1 Tax=Steccherinum ochraceum TaxID=92696 RepID=A0A4R0RLN9_9APHY|nr:hypothetical protein EIP91_000744 [Steccherinum ochraceum]
MVLVTRPRTYKDGLKLAKNSFDLLSQKEVHLWTTQGDAIFKDAEPVEITAENWHGIIKSISSLEVIETSMNAAALQVARDLFPDPEVGDLKLRLIGPSNERVTVTCTHTTPLSDIARILSRRTGHDERAFALMAPGSSHPVSCCQDKTVADMLGSPWFSGRCELYYFLRLLGGKPVIYIWTPESQQVSVQLSLSPQWEFSVLYPVSPIALVKTKEGNGQGTTWNVVTREDGSLLDVGTGLEVSYLFWEAQGFNPVQPTFTDVDSVLLHVDRITPYLDACLKALGLHTEARTSFITYWLPTMLKHKFVILRFVPQDSYEQAAPMVVSPAPDVIVRVFMIFKGVIADDIESWPLSKARANRDVSMWREAVGLTKVDQLRDKSLFRILEWGGMEVLP